MVSTYRYTLLSVRACRTWSHPPMQVVLPVRYDASSSGKDSTLSPALELLPPASGVPGMFRRSRMPHLCILQDAASRFKAKSVVVFIESSGIFADQPRASGRSGLDVREGDRIVENPGHSRKCLAIYAIRRSVQGRFGHHMPRSQ